MKRFLVVAVTLVSVLAVACGRSSTPPTAAPQGSTTSTPDTSGDTTTTDGSTTTGDLVSTTAAAPSSATSGPKATAKPKTAPTSTQVVQIQLADANADVAALSKRLDEVVGNMSRNINDVDVKLGAKISDLQTRLAAAETKLTGIQASVDKLKLDSDKARKCAADVYKWSAELHSWNDNGQTGYMPQLKKFVFDPCDTSWWDIR